jgi:hypothetical protein
LPGEQKDGEDDFHGWVVALDPSIPYAFDNDDESVIIAAPLAKFGARGDNTVVLKEGELVVVTGSKGATIINEHGSVFVPPNSSVSVSQSRFGNVEVANLDGDSAKLLVSHSGNSAELKLGAGKQLSIRSTAVAMAGARDYNTKGQEIANESPVPGLNIGHGKNAELISQSMNTLRKCRASCLLPGMKRRLDQVVDGMNFIDESSQAVPAPSSDRTVTGSGAINQHDLRAVVYASADDASNLDPKRVLTLGTQSATAKYQATTDAAIDGSGRIDVRKGEALIRADQDTVAYSHGVSIFMKKGSVAYVTSNGQTTKVFNVSDKARNSIAVAIDRHTIQTNVGQEIAVASTEREAIADMGVDKVGRRKLRILAEGAPGQLAICTSEYSILSLIQNAELPKALYRSKDRSDRKMVQDIMKMSVCQFQTTVSHGSYSQVANTTDNQGL